MTNMEHQILVASIAKKTEGMIREGARELGDMLKLMDVDVKETQKMALDMYAEAIEVLKKKHQETEKKQ